MNAVSSIKGKEISLRCGSKIPISICIVLGNHLKNAVEACEKITGKRMIQLVIKPQGEQLAIIVKNNANKSSNNGNIPQKNGGLGLRSIQSVVDRHNGDMITEYTEEEFKVFVTLMLRNAPR